MRTSSLPMSFRLFVSLTLDSKAEARKNEFKDKTCNTSFKKSSRDSIWVRKKRRQREKKIECMQRLLQKCIVIIARWKFEITFTSIYVQKNIEKYQTEAHGMQTNKTVWNRQILINLVHFFLLLLFFAAAAFLYR